MQIHPTPSVQRQRGIGLFEALIALLVLCMGMLAVARLQPGLRQQSELARQRSEAVRLAQQDIERLRSFTSLSSGSAAASAGVSAGIALSSEVIESDNGTTYRIERSVDADASLRAKQVTVSVRWTARDGSAQRVGLDAVVAAADPALSGALTLLSGDVVVRGARSRAPQVPLSAKDLGDGSSLFKPTTSDAQAWRFDNRSGAITALCSVNPAQATRDLSLADLSACTSLSGLLLSGEVHFSASAPLALGVSLRLVGPAPAIAPWCRTEALKTVAISSAAGTRLDAVPLEATPASMGAADWQERGEPFIAYHCVIVPPAGLLRWSGHVALLPQGWRIGSGADAWRTCRVSADLDGSGAIDSNLEHPPIYENVSGALTRQNFRMVRADQACPAGTVADEPMAP